MSPVRVAFLAVMAILPLTFFAGGTTAGSYLQPEFRGLFGTVTAVSGNHPRAVARETDITLDTKSGTVEFTATPETQVRIPGFESASVDDLAAGDPVAVLLTGGRAVRILVQTNLPVGTRHFTGVVTSLDDDGIISLRNRQGAQITAPVLGDLPEIQIGELVTAVVEQGVASDGLVVTGLDRATASLERVTSALELAQRSEDLPNIRVLQQRLIGNSTIHLTTLREVFQKTEPTIGSALRQKLETSREAYASVLSRSGAGKPRAEVAGIVTSIDDPGQRIIIEPHGLDIVEVAITDRTSLWRVPAGLTNARAEIWLRGEPDTRSYVERFGGREIQITQLDVANRVRVWYELETGSATRILVLPGESLPSRLTDGLLSLALQGEAKGAIVGLNLNSPAPIVAIEDEISGIVIYLSVSPDSTIGSNGLPIELSSLLDTLVTTSYDPESLTIIELNQLTPADSQATVHGVVHSFISKVRPGNFLILTLEGQLKVFNHTENTVIKRDGRRVSINEVRLGDLVRPTTRYRVGNGEQDLVVLNLKSPETVPVRGTIRGITNGPDEGTVITLSNNWLELVSLLVTSDTKLTIQSMAIEIDGLAVGQRVLAGGYDPISTKAQQLVLAAPRSLPIQGEITAIDEGRSSITISSRRSDSIELFVLESTPTRIILRGNTDPGLNDLRVGQQVRIGFYDPNSLQAMRLVVN